MLAATVGDVINLNRWRKAARRKAEAAAADANAARNGRTKAERSRALKAERQEAERHDGHRLTTSPEGVDPDPERDDEPPP